MSGTTQMAEIKTVVLVHGADAARGDEDRIVVFDVLGGRDDRSLWQKGLSVDHSTCP